MDTDDTDSSLSAADRAHRAWLQGLLDQAADYFKVTPSGAPVYGWHDRRIGTEVTRPADHAWLRVVTEHPVWASGDAWTGNADAAAIIDVPKPVVLDIKEDTDGERVVRAELSTLVPGELCSPTAQVRATTNLPDRWWTDLRTSLGTLSSTPTERACVTPEEVHRRLLVFWGLSADVLRWTTAHGDLHWANLVHPDLAILDWELWGTAPTGYDAATLYCHSLLVPALAGRVHATFADVLDTHDGRIAQLYATARRLHRIEHGDPDDLAIPLHRHANQILTAL